MDDRGRKEPLLPKRVNERIVGLDALLPETRVSRTFFVHALRLLPIARLAMLHRKTPNSTLRRIKNRKLFFILLAFGDMRSSWIWI